MNHINRVLLASRCRVMAALITMCGTAAAQDQSFSLARIGKIPPFIRKTMVAHQAVISYASKDPGMIQITLTPKQKSESQHPYIYFRFTRCKNVEEAGTTIHNILNGISAAKQQTIDDDLGNDPPGDQAMVRVYRRQNDAKILVFRRGTLAVAVQTSDAGSATMMLLAKEIDKTCLEMGHQRFDEMLAEMFAVEPAAPAPADAKPPRDKQNVFPHELTAAERGAKFRELKGKLDKAALDKTAIDQPERGMLLQEIAFLGEPESAAFLEQIVRDKKEDLLRRAQCLDSLGTLKGKESLPLCYQMIKDYPAEGAIAPETDPEAEWRGYIRTIAIRKIMFNEEPQKAMAFARGLLPNLKNEPETLHKEIPGRIEALANMLSNPPR